jgi:hypothetical protein
MFGRQSGRYKCDLVTYRYSFAGEMDVEGPVVRYLNDPNRAGIRLINVNATLLEGAVSSMSSFAQREVIILKDYTVFIRFNEAFPLGTRDLGPQEKLLVFTERFVMQGQFYTSADHNRLLDYDGPTGRWAVASDVFLYPIVPTGKSAPASARLMLLNKTAIQFFHAATEERQIPRPGG